MGALDLLTPDQKRIRSHILGVYLTDSANGKSLLVASVKDSIGTLLPPNQIVYRSAFDGLNADVRFTYRKRVVLSRSAEGIELSDDALLDFGGMLMIPGKAFSINKATPALDSQRTSAHVLKQWRQINGRQLLIESVPWNEVEPHLKSLPQFAADIKRPARTERELPIKQIAAKDSKPVQVASLPYTEKGFVIDFVITVTTQPTWTFLSGQTYLVANNVTISDWATFQAGAIIKVDRSAALTLAGLVSCPSDGSVFFTARDDDSMGESTSTGSLTGYYGSPAYINLYYNSVPPQSVLKKLNVRYAREGVTAYRPNTTQVVEDSRFENCEKGVTAYYTTMTLRNLIMCNTPTQYYNYGSSYFYLSGVTADCAGSVRFTTIGNGAVLQGTATLPIEVVTGDLDSQGEYVTANGEAVNGLGLTTVNGNPRAVWNTTLVPNGSYQLQVGSQLGTDSEILGSPLTITVDNTIWFPTWQSDCGDAMRIEVRTKHLNGSWIIDIYDDQDIF